MITFDFSNVPETACIPRAQHENELRLGRDNFMKNDDGGRLTVRVWQTRAISEPPPRRTWREMSVSGRSTAPQGITQESEKNQVIQPMRRVLSVPENTSRGTTDAPNESEIAPNRTMRPLDAALRSQIGGTR